MNRTFRIVLAGLVVAAVAAAFLLRSDSSPFSSQAKPSLPFSSGSSTSKTGVAQEMAPYIHQPSSFVYANNLAVNTSSAPAFEIGGVDEKFIQAIANGFGLKIVKAEVSAREDTSANLAIATVDGVPRMSYFRACTGDDCIVSSCTGTVEPTVNNIVADSSDSSSTPDVSLCEAPPVSGLLSQSDAERKVRTVIEKSLPEGAKIGSLVGEVSKSASTVTVQFSYGGIKLIDNDLVVSFGENGRLESISGPAFSTTGLGSYDLATLEEAKKRLESGKYFSTDPRMLMEKKVDCAPGTTCATGPTEVTSVEIALTVQYSDKAYLVPTFVFKHKDGSFKVPAVRDEDLATATTTTSTTAADGASVPPMGGAPGGSSGSSEGSTSEGSEGHGVEPGPLSDQ